MQVLVHVSHLPGFHLGAGFLEPQPHSVAEQAELVHLSGCAYHPTPPTPPKNNLIGF